MAQVARLRLLEHKSLFRAAIGSPHADEPALPVHVHPPERPLLARSHPMGDGEEKVEKTLAYRLRLFSLDRWNLWTRLALYRTCGDKDCGRLDETNNATERAIGWWVNERYRTMRGYKCQESA